MTPNAEKVRRYLGQRVRVFYGRDEGGDSLVLIGKLLEFSDGGDFTVLDDNGFVHYCWPMLEVSPIGSSGTDGR
jgi:hypothetical protein